MVIPFYSSNIAYSWQYLPYTLHCFKSKSAFDGFTICRHEEHKKSTLFTPSFSIQYGHNISFAIFMISFHPSLFSLVFLMNLCHSSGFQNSLHHHPTITLIATLHLLEVLQTDFRQSKILFFY